MKKLPWVILLAAFIYEAVAFYISVRPVERIPEYFWSQDKVLHFVMYFTMGLLLSVSSALGARRYIYAGGVLAGLLIGIVSEFLQHWVPGRTASVMDAIMNILGLMFVIAVYEGARLWVRGGVLYREITPPNDDEKKKNKDVSGTDNS